MTEKQNTVIRLLADHNMVVAKVAAEMQNSPSTVRNHINQIRVRTGKNPLDFRELGELLDIVERNKTIATCKVCGRKFEAERKHHQNIQLCSQECRDLVEEERRLKKIEYLQRYRQQEKEMQRLQKLESRKKPAPIRLTVFPTMSLAEVNEKARAAGLTYGRFVAQWRGT